MSLSLTLSSQLITTVSRLNESSIVSVSLLIETMLLLFRLTSQLVLESEDSATTDKDIECGRLVGSNLSRQVNPQYSTSMT